jgi:hypothetical protein
MLRYAKNILLRYDRKRQAPLCEEVNTMTEGTLTSSDRRSGMDRRRAYRFGLFSKDGVEKREGEERRSRHERRKGWVRVDRWSSVQLERLKIAKFLKQPISKEASKTRS